MGAGAGTSIGCGHRSTGQAGGVCVCVVIKVGGGGGSEVCPSLWWWIMQTLANAVAKRRYTRGSR